MFIGMVNYLCVLIVIELVCLMFCSWCVVCLLRSLVFF